MNKLYIVNGDTPKEMTLELLSYLKPMKGVKKDAIIGIKPNLVTASPASHGATTHPEIIESIIIYLQNNGYDNIKIIEGAWVGDSTKRAYDVCGYNALAKKYNVALFDTKGDAHYTEKYKSLDINICNVVKDIDFLINVPLIKGHCQTSITCALKNMKGLIPDSEKRRFHTLGLHKPIAYLNKFIKHDLIIADGICPDPYFEEGGRPQKLNRIVASFDPVLIDSYAAKVLGYEVSDIKYIELATKEGIGNTMNNNTELVNINEVSTKDINIKQKDKKYLNIVEEASACSACYSNLVSALTKLNEEGYSEKFVVPICIGQSYRNYEGKLGIGSCTSSFHKNLPGCPPSVDEIITFLKTNVG